MALWVTWGAKPAEGDLDFIRFHRLLPWDHAPGVLLLTESGGISRHHDKASYQPTGIRSGLLNAADIGTWNAAHDLLGFGSFTIGN